MTDSSNDSDPVEGGGSNGGDTVEDEYANWQRCYVEWALRSDVPQNTLSDLLCVRQELSPNLPKQARNLLQTAKIAVKKKNKRR